MPAKLPDLIARLPALQPLATHLVDVLSNRRESPLGQALRQDAAVRFVPDPHEALGLALDLLIRRAGYSGELDLRALATLGPDGQKAASLIEDALARPAAPASSHDTAQVLTAALDAIPYFERAKVDALFKLPAAPAVARDELAAPVAKVASAKGLANAPKVAFGDLLGALTYGTGAIVDLAREALNAVPPTALGQKLASTRHGMDTDAQVGARLLAVLWQYRDRDQLDAAKLSADFPAEAPKLLAALKGAQAVVQPDRPNYPAMAELVKNLPANPELVDALVHGPGLIPRSLPSLEAVGAQVSDGALKGKGLIGAQHLLTNTASLIEMCLKKGMSPQDIHLVGTPYNNNPLVIEYLQSLGVDVVPGRDNLGSTRFLKEQKLQELEEFVSHVSRAPPPPGGWRILDDGGLLQKVITGTEQSSYGREHLDTAELRRVFSAANSEAIEQTTRGLTEVPNPLYPTVAVARARGKKMEGEYIGWALADSLVMELKQRGYDLKKVKVGVTGAGTVGMWAAEQLRKVGVQVTIVDINPDVVKAAKEKGFAATADAREALPNVEVMLSASGKNIWPGDVLAGWDGLMLSGSSMAAEFDVDQINAFRSTPLEVGNVGRPINFHGDGYAVLEPQEIGITLGLLFAGIAQERPASGAGYVDVDPKLEDPAIAAWQQTRGPVRKIATRETPAQRPDLLSNDGTATHEQWLSFLGSLRRPVYPPPNSVRGQVPVYFFQDDDGQVRQVDTRTGKSQVVPLPSVPDQGYPLDSSGSRYFFGTGDTAWLWSPATGDFASAGRFAGEAARYLRDETPLSGGAQNVTVGVALRNEAGFAVLPPGGSGFVQLPRTTKGEALTVWPNREVVLQIQKKPPKISAHPLPEGGFFANMWNNVRLPERLVEVDAVASWPRQQMQVVIGKTAGGETLIAPLRPSALSEQGQETVLPKGATFRGLRPTEDGLQGSFIVDYTMPSDPVELSSYRHLTVDILGPVLDRVRGR